jgi:hypothetical protein
MRKRSTRAFALLGATALLTFGGAVPALATGAQRASGVQYKGTTSQGLPFSITRSGSKVSVNFNFKAKCSSGPLKSVSTDAGGNGKVKGSKFTASGGMTYPAGGGYMGEYKLKVAGRISSTKTSGTFSVDNGVYNVTTGKKVGTCNTGKQTFKGHKA